MRLDCLPDPAHSTSSAAVRVRIVRRRRESMRLPVDTSSIAFLCALEPQPVLAFDTKQPRADENGEPLYVVQLIALAEGKRRRAEEGGDAHHATVREGTGAAAKRATVPSTHQTRCANTWPLHQE
jgi:hypothetical protein